MASSKPQPATLKRLAQLLEEQQEPFTLEVYLSERTYRKRSPENSSKNFNRSHKVKGGRGISSGSSILKLAINKLISNKNFRQLIRCENKARKDRGKQASGTTRKKQHNAARKGSSSSISTSSIHSSSEEDAKKCFRRTKQSHGSTFQALRLDNLTELEAATNTKLQCAYMEESKQLSPVSVLELPPDADSQAYYKYNQLLFQMNENSPQYGKPKPVSMQTKQLLCVCVKENVICHQISSWGKQHGDVKSINQLIHSDFSVTAELWRNFQLLNEDVGIDIAEAILYDICTELINFEICGY